jgi:hypothetical protein
METVERSKSKSDISTVSTALANPEKGAGFAHSHSDGGGFTFRSDDLPQLESTHKFC